MKAPDLDRIRSEKTLTMKEFISTYNKDLPAGFPPATTPMMKAFFATHAQYFKRGSEWSLDQHRKRIMDWLPGQVKKEEAAEV